jgi:hypothetical protein
MNIGKVMAFGMIAALASFGVACGGGEVPEAKAPETPEAKAPETPETPETPEAPAGGEEKPAEGAAEEGK